MPPRSRLATALIWATGLAPLADSLIRGVPAGLGGQLHMTAELGTWGLRFLVAALAAAPLAAVLRRPALLAYRRDIGLLGFAYALAHVAACLIVGRAWTWSWEALAARIDFVPGLITLLVLIPAAATAIAPVRARVGPAAARRMQGLTLAAAPLAALHYGLPLDYWTWAPIVYGVLALALIAWRFLPKAEAAPRA